MEEAKTILPTQVVIRKTQTKRNTKQNQVVSGCTSRTNNKQEGTYEALAQSIATLAPWTKSHIKWRIPWFQFRGKACYSLYWYLEEIDQIFECEECISNTEIQARKAGTSTKLGNRENTNETVKVVHTWVCQKLWGGECIFRCRV